MAYKIEELQADGAWATYAEVNNLDTALRWAFDLASGQGVANDYRVLNQQGDLKAHYHHIHQQTVDLTGVGPAAFLSNYLRHTWNLHGADLMLLLSLVMTDDGYDQIARSLADWADDMLAQPKRKRKERSYIR